MTDEQKQAVRENMMNAMRDREMKPIREFFLLKTPQDRNAHLDKIIAAEEARQKQFEEMRKKWEAERAKNPNANQGRDRQRGQGQRGQQNAGNNQQRGSGGPRGVRSQESRDNRRRDYLDHTSPQERAMRSEYIQAVRKRREELGLPPRSGRGWGRGR